MASVYEELKKGAQGNNVSALQSSLKNAGLNTAVTGIYDDATEAAVKQYQQQQQLNATGVAGNETLQKLYNTENQEAPYGYTPSATVTQAQKYLESLQQTKPGEYQNAWQGQLDDLLSKIQNRQAFSYDPSTDPVYNIYKDIYQNDGRRAMQDTMGQAAALTGGYGNSYAQSVGQQTYNQYMEKIHQLVPQLQQQAYQQYADEGDRMLNNYALLNSRENQDYDRYRQGVEDWNQEQANAQNQYYNLYDRDVNLFNNQRTYDQALQEREDRLASENRQYAYNVSMAMIQRGKVPSSTMLSQAGIPLADAKALAKAYKSKGRGGDDKETAERIALIAKAYGIPDYGEYRQAIRDGKINYTGNSYTQTYIDEYKKYVTNAIANAKNSKMLTNKEATLLANQKEAEVQDLKKTAAKVDARSSEAKKKTKYEE